VKLSEVCEYSAKQSNTAICSLCKSAIVTKGENRSNILAYLWVHHPLKHIEVWTAMKCAKHKCSESK